MNKLNFVFILLLLIFGLVSLLNPLYSFAQENYNNLTLPEREQKKKELELELDRILKEIDEYNQKIKDLTAQKENLNRDLQIIESRIKKVALEIKAINLEIKNLEARIADTEKSIGIIEEKINLSKKNLEIFIRYYYLSKQRDLLDVILSEAKVSSYFSYLVAMNKFQERINYEIKNLNELRQKLENQKLNLEQSFEEKTELLKLSKAKEAQLKSLKQEKEKLLAYIKEQNQAYQKKLISSQKTAAQIRAQIYQLAGGQDITFGEALEYANYASKLTGVRSALILAVLDYESKIGRNVGNCHYKQSMKPSEWPIFENITRELGLDPDKMPVSCKPWYGWGGAMGPAQFIPSTWMKYKDEIANLSGHNPPSPWNILDAFIAAALFLKKAGADKQTYEAEWKAAMIYFAGSNWSKPSLRFYGDDVLYIAGKYERDIKSLSGS